VVDEVDKGSLAQRLYRSPTQLSLELRALAEQHDAKVLLFVDQLEELLTLNDSTELHQRFMQAICTAADDALDPVRVVFAARDDFLARLAVGPEAREALRHVTVMQTLEPSALREVLLRPIEAIGYRYEDDALVDEMIDAVRGEPACLPLLQFAAQLLWERADKSKRLLLRSPYDEMGGVAGALAKHADGVLDALSPPELDLARALLLRLCTAEGTRRVIAREPLLHGLDGGAEQVLDRLIEARLVTVTKSRGAVESDALLELAHESLIRNWATLARWLADSGEEVAFLAEVEQAAELWRKRGRRADELWRGDALRDALRRWERIVHRAAAASRDFLSAGRDAELRRVRGRRAITAVAGATLVAAALVFALQKREANRQRDIAEQERTRAIEQRTLADQRRGQALIEGARSALSQGRQLEARAKLRMALEIGDDPAARALWWQLADEPIAWNARLGTYVYGVSFSPDGTKLAAACGDGAIHLFDTRTQSSRSLRGHRDPKALTVSFSPDGRQLASAGWDNEVRLWDVEQGRAIRAFAGHRDGIYGLSFSPDGATIASASIDRTVRTWNVATGQAIATLEHPGGVHAVRFDPSGTLLASACVDGRVRLWNTSGALVREIAGHEQPARDIAFTPDSRSLASAGNDGRVRLWDVATGETRGTIHAHSDRATAVAISPNGKLLLSGGFPGELRLWNLETKQLLRELPGHGESVWSVTFDRSGALAASTGFDYEVRLWDVAKAAVPGRTTKPHSKGVQRVAFSPDGKTLLSSGGDNTMRMWRMTTGEVFRVIQGHTGRVNMVAFSPDGQRIASASHDRTVRIWSSETGKELLSYGGHRSAAVAVAFSIDGRIVTSGGYDGSIASWDARTGRELHTFEGHTLGVLDLTLANDALLASASFDGTARLWDFKTGKLVTVLESLGKLYGVGLDPSATRLATAGNDGTLRLFDVGKRPPIELMRKSHPGRLLDAHYSRDGRSIAAAHSDGSVSVTAVATGSVHRWTAHSGEVNGVELSADGSLLASCADDGTVRLWDAATGTTKWRGPALLPSPVRFFSHRGWHSGDGTSLASPTQAFGKAIEQHALFAEASASVACVHTEDGTELWDVARDAPLGKLAGKTLDVRAMPNGCVIRERDAVRLLTKDGITEIPIGSPSVAAWVPPASGSAIEHGGVAVATETELIAYDASGRELSRVSVGGGVKAIARAHDGTLIIGFGDGGIELHGARGKRADAPSFEQVPASAVSRIVPGPGSTAAIGYSNGVVGLWSLTDGKLFASELLHGQVHHLLIEGQTLHAASDLGDRLAWDLRAFSEDYCHLLQKIWGAVPVVWSSGRAVESVPVHRCVDASTH
jgi:WD40 repeat protein